MPNVTWTYTYGITKDRPEGFQRSVQVHVDSNTSMVSMGGKDCLPIDTVEEIARECKKKVDEDAGWGNRIYPVQPDGTIDASSPYVVSPSGQGYYPMERTNGYYAAVAVNAGFPSGHGRHLNAVGKALDSVGAYEGGDKLLKAIGDRMRRDREDDNGLRHNGGSDPSVDPWKDLHTNRNYREALEYNDLF